MDKCVEKISAETKREKAIRHILFHCGSLKTEEVLLVICNPETEKIANDIASIAESHSQAVNVDVIENASAHGMEPPSDTAEKMSAASLIVCLTMKSLAHTKARHQSASKGTRFLSMADYDDALLVSDAVMTDYRQQYKVVRSVADKFTHGHKARVTTRNGTDVSSILDGRIGNCCPGYVDEPGALGSPPDIEANVSPVEESSNGRIIVDGSIACPEIGLLEEPVSLTVEDGNISHWESPNAETIRLLEKLFDDVGTPAARVLAEIGVGLNPNASLTGSMLTDEGALGCIHFGFGANSTVGGENNVPFHLDFIVRDATLHIDGECILKDGVLKI